MFWALECFLPGIYYCIYAKEFKANVMSVEEGGGRGRAKETGLEGVVEETAGL